MTQYIYNISRSKELESAYSLKILNISQKTILVKYEKSHKPHISWNYELANIKPQLDTISNSLD